MLIMQVFCFHCCMKIVVAMIMKILKILHRKGTCALFMLGFIHIQFDKVKLFKQYILLHEKHVRVLCDFNCSVWLSGRALDSRLKGRGFEPHRRHCVVSLSKNINPSLVLVQPRKTRPFITERLLMGRKESNQTKN